jgi:hypothetical protein
LHPSAQYVPLQQLEISHKRTNSLSLSLSTWPVAPHTSLRGLELLFQSSFSSSATSFGCLSTSGSPSGLSHLVFFNDSRDASTQRAYLGVIRNVTTACQTWRRFCRSLVLSVWAGPAVQSVCSSHRHRSPFLLEPGVVVSVLFRMPPRWISYRGLTFE